MSEENKNFENEESIVIENETKKFSFREFWRLHRKSILKVILVFFVLFLISLAIIGILYACDVFHFSQDDGFQFNTERFATLRVEPWFPIATVGLMVAVGIFASFIPAGSMAMILGTVAIWYGEDLWIAFVVSLSAVVITSVLMDVIGRFGGSRFIVWLIGQKEYDSALNLLKTKKYSYLPIMYSLPVFPDDALCLVAGTSKLNFLYHLIIIIVFRGVGVAFTVYGLGAIPWETFDSFWSWMVVGAVLIVWVTVILKIANFIDRKFSGFFISINDAQEIRRQKRIEKREEKKRLAEERESAEIKESK